MIVFCKVFLDINKFMTYSIICLHIDVLKTFINVKVNKKIYDVFTNDIFINAGTFISLIIK